jgi:hypothetical protein
LIILHIAKTEFNNCFIIHLFVTVYSQNKEPSHFRNLFCIYVICSIFCSDYRFIGTYRVRIRQNFAFLPLYTSICSNGYTFRQILCIKFAKLRSYSDICWQICFKPSPIVCSYCTNLKLPTTIIWRTKMKISQLLWKESNERCTLCCKLTYIKERKGNSTAIFADKNRYRK